MPKNIKKTQRKNVFTLRVNNKNTFDIFNALLGTKFFESANVLLNKILDAGVPEFAKRYLGKDVKTVKTGTAGADAKAEFDLPRSVKQIEKTLDDMYVNTSVLEYMMAKIYNERLHELRGEKLTVADLEGGLLSQLPPDLQAIKDSIMAEQSRRNG